MSIKIIAMPLLVSLLIVTSMSCGKAAKSPEAGAHKLKVVASLYPLYDFVRNVGKEKVDVELLLPPGVEPHSFEPNPADILHVNRSDIFVYTNKYMEPWVEDIIKGMDNTKMLILDSSRGLLFMEDRDDGDEGPHGKKSRGHAGMDPHIWLDLGNAIMMVDTVRDGLIQKDPANQDYYQNNAAHYKSVLQGLDQKFRQGLSACKKRVFINGGHFAFGYLARRYGLTYVSAYGFSPDAEPTPGQLVKISRMLRQQGLKYLFYEELLTPRVAEMLARETGVQLLFLHGAHNISREEFTRGVSFVELMENNLENLKTGLQCR
jgi:zinc transport system substrate-binding protein